MELAERIIISYIVPCYNIQDYLPRCLDSLVSQRTSDDFTVEFILVNDGSTDATLSLLREFGEKEPRSVIIDQQNQGVSAARNAGLEMARGEYVYFLDGDDYLTDDATQILYELCKKDAPDIIIANAYIVQDGQWDIKKEWNTCRGINAGCYKTLEFAQLVKRLPISFKAYCREMLLRNHIRYDNELRVGEVYTFFLHAMTCSDSIAYTDKRIMNYVVRNSSVMRTVNLKRDSTIIQAMHNIDGYARGKMPELLNLPSYKLSLIGIANLFDIFNYVRKSPYTPEIGKLLNSIRNDSIYRDSQKYLIRMEAGFNRKTLYRILLYYLPVPLSYRLLRFSRYIKSFVK